MSTNAGIISLFCLQRNEKFNIYATFSSAFCNYQFLIFICEEKTPTFGD